MREMCELVEKWLIRYDLGINADKSEVVRCGKGRGTEVTIGGEVIRVKRAYKYLGYVMDGGMKGNEHFRERREKMSMALGVFLGVIGAIEGVTADKKVIMARACVCLGSIRQSLFHFPFFCRMKKWPKPPFLSQSDKKCSTMACVRTKSICKVKKGENPIRRRGFLRIQKYPLFSVFYY